MFVQATCIAIDQRAIMIRGAPGTGKSTLALALIDRGARLISDDGVFISASDGKLQARPVPATLGLLEIRNLGLITLPYLSTAVISLIIELTGDAPRYIEKASHQEYLDVRVPFLAMTPHDWILPLKVELALSRFGA